MPPSPLASQPPARRARALHLRLLAGAGLALVASPLTGQTALDYFDWPAPAEFPTPNGKSYFNWTPRATDSYDDTALLDLRHLNEDEAGQDGWVTHRDGRFHLGSGEPVRFWAVNINAGSLSAMQDQARFLAKKGVNLVRVHGPTKSLVQTSSNNVRDVNLTVVDEMHRVVQAMRGEGIYTAVSNTYFVITVDIRAAWNIPGFTSAWIAAHPDDLNPYGLIFLDDTLRSAYLEWLRVLMTRPNPHAPGQIPLAQDPAVALVEILNEDNLFFYTFEPATRWPPEMQALQNAKFFDWVVEKYRDPAQPGETDTQVATRVLETVWNNRTRTGDDLPNGRFALGTAWEMANQTPTSLIPRFADQILYLAEQQERFFADAVAVLRTAGYGGTVSGSNWKTARDELLLDLELMTYTTAGVPDVHNYFSPAASTTAQSWRHTAGDTSLFLPMVVNPRRGAVANKHIAAHPLTVSETTWTNFSGVTQEGPLLVAAYSALTDLDGWVWFAQDKDKWHTGLRMWPVAYPNLMGQFPGAALLYRRGYVTEAPVVMREGRTYASIARREVGLTSPSRGFDPTRDNPSRWNYDPTTGRGTIDPLTMLMGRVEVTPETDEDFLRPDLVDTVRTNASAGRVRSVTGEVVTDWNRGLTTVDSARAQAAVGFLRAAGPIGLGDVTIAADMNFAAVLVASLDDLPLAQCERLLVQAAGHNRLTGFSASPVSMTWNGHAYAGLKLDALGSTPWQMERIAATVTLRGAAGRVLQARALDEDGYPETTVTVQTSGDDLVLPLPATSIYTVVELQPVADRHPVILPTGLPMGWKDQAYAARLQALAGDPPLTWSLPEGPLLPAGLQLDPDGAIHGTPSEGARRSLTVQVADADGDTATATFPLHLFPLPEPPLWGDPSATPKSTALGWVWDLPYPFVYAYSAAAFLWIHPEAKADSAYFYVFAEGGYWAWTSDTYGPWHYRFDGPSAGWQRWP